MARFNRNSDFDDQPLFVDSGRDGDEVHVVALRGFGDGIESGLIKGDLPQLFVWRSQVYTRSTFTHRSAGGVLVHTYYPKAEPR